MQMPCWDGYHGMTSNQNQQTNRNTSQTMKLANLLTTSNRPKDDFKNDLESIFKDGIIKLKNQAVLWAIQNDSLVDEIRVIWQWFKRVIRKWSINWVVQTYINRAVTVWSGNKQVSKQHWMNIRICSNYRYSDIETAYPYWGIRVCEIQKELSARPYPPVDVSSSLKKVKRYTKHWNRKTKVKQLIIEVSNNNMNRLHQENKLQWLKKDKSN